ncbi:hypothetical protein ACQPZZ_17135 [Microbispora sp. CA-135349]|uniref:hypothetical protein n=1 Tax=Microbispora sp. CA-135349 TaxID=3239953 RepID=UPI003D8EAC27
MILAPADAPASVRKRSDRPVLRMGRAAGRVFPERGTYEFEPARLQVIADHQASFGLPPIDHEKVSAQLASGGLHSFIAMGERLLADVPGLPDLDVVVLAHETPDLDFSASAACFLAYRCRGERTVAFSVSDQGVGAPFTALRLVERMVAAGQARTGAVFVFDQNTLPFWDDRVHGAAVRDAGAAIVVGTGLDGPALASVWEVPVEPGRLAAEVGRVRRELPADRAVLLLGSTLASCARELGAGGDEVRVAPERHLCTATWLELAGHDRRQDAALLLADYDPATGRLHAAGFLPGPEEEAS